MNTESTSPKVFDADTRQAVNTHGSIGQQRLKRYDTGRSVRLLHQPGSTFNQHDCVSGIW